jgi:hypothetical protein
MGLAAVLSDRVLNVPYVINWWIPFIGVVGGIRRDFPLRGSGIKCQDWVVQFNLKPLLKEKSHARDYTSWCGFGKVRNPDSRSEFQWHRG